MPKRHVYEYLPEFIGALEEQLKADEKRWGNTWQQRPHYGQEDRIVNRILDYYNDFVDNGAPFPWLKVAGLALIGWIRATELSRKLELEENHDNKAL